MEKNMEHEMETGVIQGFHILSCGLKVEGSGPRHGPPLPCLDSL